MAGPLSTFVIVVIVVIVIVVIVIVVIVVIVIVGTVVIVVIVVINKFYSSRCFRVSAQFCHKLSKKQEESNLTEFATQGLKFGEPPPSLLLHPNVIRQGPVQPQILTSMSMHGSGFIALLTLRLSPSSRDRQNRITSPQHS